MDDEIRKDEVQPEEERLTEDPVEEIVAEATDMAQEPTESDVNASAPSAADADTEDAGAERASSQTEPAAEPAVSAPSDRAAAEPRRDFASLSAAAGRIAAAAGDASSEAASAAREAAEAAAAAGDASSEAAGDAREAAEAAGANSGAATEDTEAAPADTAAGDASSEAASADREAAEAAGANSGAATEDTEAAPAETAAGDASSEAAGAATGQGLFAGVEAAPVDYSVAKGASVRVNPERTEETEAGADDFFASYEAEAAPEEPAEEKPAWQQTRMAGSFSSIYSDTEGGGTYNPIPDEPVKKARPGLAKKILTAALTICLCFGAGFGGSVLGNRTSGSHNSVGSAAGTANATAVSISGDLDSLDAASAIAQKLMPSVVGISTVSQTLTETIYGLQSGQSMGIGTGFIVSEDGYILTNSHVVNDGDAETITVDLYDGTEYAGSILWNDPSLDLAVVKIDASGLTPAELGDSDTVQIGNYALAIGNPLGLDFERSVTSGIISGLNRSITVATSASSTTGNTMEGLIQTDASINSGNSGGPLINSAGQVIGINSAKASSAEGLGFSIPINVAIPIIQKVMETGTYDAAYIGITGYDLAAVISSYGNEATFSSSTGVYVNEVYEGSGAAAAGIQAGDVILGINDVQIVGMSSLKTQLVRYNPGDTITILLERNQEQISVDVTLGSASEASNVVVGSQEAQEPAEEAPVEGEEPQQVPEEQPGEEDNGFGSYGGLDDLFDNFFGNR